MKKHNELNCLTSIRGAAAWWVALYHFREFIPISESNLIMRVIAHGDFAVDLFFQLSGFVISMNYCAKLSSGNLNEVKRFFILRFGRIYPLHIFILLLMTINPIAIICCSSRNILGDRYSLEYFFLSVALMQNWGFTNIVSWNIPSWSISTEMFAYIAFPFFAFISDRILTNRSRAAFAIVFFLALLILIWTMAGAALGDRIPSLGLSRCVIQFVVGACVHHVVKHQGPAPTIVGDTAVVMATLSLQLWAVAPYAPDYVVVPCAWACLVFGLGSVGRFAVWLSRSSFALFVGEISYSTYLIHYLVKDWIKFLFVHDDRPDFLLVGTFIVMTALASLLLFKFVEEPGRNRFRSLVERRV